jgi:tetratricopeptide (TPR) repeat protein
LRDSSDQGAYYRAWARVASAAAVLRDAAATEAALANMRELLGENWAPIVRLWGAEAEAFACHFRGDYDEALRWFRAELTLAHDAGLTSTALNNIADAALAAGHTEEAIASGRKLVEQLSGGRHQYLLAVARLNLAAALLAQGEPIEAREIAQAGWALAAQFDLQAAYADHLALLAALEKRPRAAVLLVGYSDTAYTADGGRRPPNEANSAQRATAIATEMLGEATVRALRAAGAKLREEGMAELAFATRDSD